MRSCAGRQLKHAFPPDVSEEKSLLLEVTRGSPRVIEVHVGSFQVRQQPLRADIGALERSRETGRRVPNVFEGELRRASGRNAVDAGLGLLAIRV